MCIRFNAPNFHQSTEGLAVEPDETVTVEVTVSEPQLDCIRRGVFRQTVVVFVKESPNASIVIEKSILDAMRKEGMHERASITAEDLAHATARRLDNKLREQRLSVRDMEVYRSFELCPVS